MAQIAEQVVMIRFSKLVSNKKTLAAVLSKEQLEMLEASIPELVQSIVDDETIVVEVDTDH